MVSLFANLLFPDLYLCLLLCCFINYYSLSGHFLFVTKATWSISCLLSSPILTVSLVFILSNGLICFSAKAKALFVSFPQALYLFSRQSFSFLTQFLNFASSFLRSVGWAIQELLVYTLIFCLTTLLLFQLNRCFLNLNYY